MPTGQYRFSIKMFDFSGSNLESTEPYLKLDFDKFKLFQTDKEKSGNPEWGFKAAFMYRTKTLDKLPTKKFRIFCFDAAEKCPVDKVSVEWYHLKVVSWRISSTALEASPPEKR